VQLLSYFRAIGEVSASPGLYSPIQSVEVGLETLPNVTDTFPPGETLDGSRSG
jgi:hypothetical protein